MDMYSLDCLIMSGHFLHITALSFTEYFAFKICNKNRVLVAYMKNRKKNL